ncbi:MAG TPA: hypothetical protein VFN69_06615, partial [Rudaea sp.]|nr:hypothetical protein [Rudaea sp.]
EAGFLPVQAAQQRISAYGGWSEGDASFTGPNPKDGARIAYYQKSRHLFGKLKIDILDAKGEVIDSIPANVRRGINLVYWSMRVKPPRVPPAAQIAFNSTQGARVPPGTYTVRMTKGDATFETKLDVGLDRRATYSAADRQAQYNAAQRVSALFGRMSDLVYQLSAVRMQVDANAAKLGEKDALRQQLAQLGDKADEIRKKIVATKQGGAITGEERLREHADTLYGAIMSYDGKPADYQLARIDTLTRELDDVAKQFSDLQKNELAKANAALQSAKHAPIMVPPAAPADKSGGSAEAAKAYFSRFERD